MNIPRAVVLGVAGGALVAWFAAASTSGTRVPVVPTTTRVPAVDKSGAELAAEIERLHERLRPTNAPATPVRNLFDFSAAPGGASVAPAAAAPLSVIAPPAAPPPAPLTLIGVAEDAGVRTAIISRSGELFLVKEGDRVADRYTVTRVDSNAVELADTSGTSDGRAVRLALK